VWDASRGLFLRYGFSDELTVCQGLEWVLRFFRRSFVILIQAQTE
jgi:hypothetical protein